MLLPKSWLFIPSMICSRSHSTDISICENIKAYITFFYLPILHKKFWWNNCLESKQTTPKKKKKEHLVMCFHKLLGCLQQR